ncbi:MAG: DUF3696 domain-containing protein [Candidatus Zixiibacteriota bacterium]
MITKLRIKNFKCLQDTNELEIRPLTLLVGPNSSGKSSLLQMLLMLRQTIDSTDINIPLAANNGWVQMGAYPGFIFKGEYSRELEVNFEITQFFPAGLSKKEHRRTPQKLFIRAVFCYNRKTTQIDLKESEINKDDTINQKILRGQKGKKYLGIVSWIEKGERQEWRSDDVDPFKFYGFTPHLKRRAKMKDLLESFPGEQFFLRFIIEREFRNMYYLGPLREFPKRFYVTTGQAPQDVGTRGERAVDVLWFTHLSESKRIRKIQDEVRSWFKKFNFATNIRLARIGKGNYYRVLIIDPATEVETTLADIGFGASQTLPIIIESFYAPPSSVILIEQPEIHLHPKAQSILGDLFINAASEGNRTFIIETHSEHILARIRRRIAEKQIAKEKVAIYYFEPTPEGTHIQEVTLNKYGQYENFPKSFFEEDVIEAFEHLKAIKG